MLKREIMKAVENSEVVTVNWGGYQKRAYIIGAYSATQIKRKQYWDNYAGMSYRPGRGNRHIMAVEINGEWVPRVMTSAKLVHRGEPTGEMVPLKPGQYYD